MDKCSGVSCPLTINCKRYSLIQNKVGIYHHKPPFKIYHGMFKCKLYIGDPAKLLFYQLFGMNQKEFTKKSGFKATLITNK